MIGRVLAHYQIVESLGRGGMGDVYAARDTALGRIVALKILPPEMALSDDHRVRFNREAQAVAALNHPNIVTVFSVEEDEGIHFITMELVRGKTLTELLAENGLELSHFLDLALALTDAVSAAHRKGVIHRDLKPDNLMEDEEGRLKILDFGLVKWQQDVEGRGLSELSTQGVTETGRILGTVAYMSPEQAEGRRVDLRTDIFSLGTTLYEMATGQRPFSGTNSTSVLASILRDTPAPVTEINPALPVALSEIIQRCHAKKPEHRYPSAKDIHGALAQLKREVESGDAMTGATRHSEKRFTSLAVLPLKSLSRDPEDNFFADGMTEALIGVLSGIKALRVISRTSVMRYQNTTRPLPEIARELNVEAIVEGSVLHDEGRVRISSQLIDGARDQHLWAGSYDRDLTDILKLQNEVARVIAREVRVALTPQEETQLATAPRVDQEAHVAYLKGRFHLNKRDIQPAVHWFEVAIARDATYAPSHAGLAECLTILGTAGFGDVQENIGARAKAVALTAVQLDETLAEAHTALGYVHFRLGWFWEAAEPEFKKALELNPRFATAEQYYAMLLILMGRDEAALNAISHAIELDPLSPILLTRILHWARRFDEAIEQFQAVLELEPGFTQAHFDVGMSYSRVGRHEAAVESLKRAVSLSGRRPIMVGMLASLLGLAGRRAEIPDLLEEVRADGYAGIVMAMVHLALDEFEQAMDVVEKACDGRDGALIYFVLEPIADPLRSSPRFQNVLRRMRLPEREDRAGA